MPSPPLLNAAWLSACAACVLFIPIAYYLVGHGLGESRRNNVTKFLATLCVSVAVYWAIGGGLMFGTTAGGWIGTDGFMVSQTSDAWPLSCFLFELACCTVVASFVTVMIADRTRLCGTILIAVLISGVMYPVLGHWIWSGVLDGNPNGWLAELGFRDFAGASAVFASAGWIALAARAVTKGERLTMTSGRPTDSVSLPALAAGTLLFWLGTLGFNAGHTFSLTSAIPTVLLNASLAAVFAAVVGLFASMKGADGRYVIQGLVGGLVAISAGSQIVSVMGAICVGVIAGVLTTAISKTQARRGWQPPTEWALIFALCGTWGVLSLALVGDSQALGGDTRAKQLAVQAAGAAVCFGWTFVGSFCLLRGLHFFMQLGEEQERDFEEPGVTAEDLCEGAFASDSRVPAFDLEFTDAFGADNALDLGGASSFAELQPATENNTPAKSDDSDASFVSTAQESDITSDESQRIKNRFLATMSHETRTWLNGVIGMLDLLANTNLDSQQRSYCELGQASAEALLSQINDILDIGKLETGKLEVEHVNFELRELLDSVPGMFAQAASENGIDIHSEVSEEVPDYAVGDPARLRQILINLFDNAVKFTEEGGVRFHATLASDANETGQFVLCLEVADTGIGISAESLQKVFEPFNNLDSRSSHRNTGIGLGLALSKQLLDLMGGKIQVDTAPERGATFWVRVPLMLGKPQKEPDLTHLRGAKILVVDRELANQRILSEYLRDWELAVTFCETPVEALDCLQTARQEQTPFQIIILDDLLLQIDGAEFAEAIHGYSNNEQPRIILQTSVDEAFDQHRLRDLDVTFLPKPIRRRRLLEALMSSEMDEGPEAGARPAADSDANTSEFRGRRILIVDDNEVNRIVAGEILKSVGCDTVAMDNGQLAVEAIQSERFDAVLMDCEMPVMDGFAATRQIRQAELDAPNRQALPIIAVTAQAVKGDRERCLEAGMTAYVSKPVNRDELIRTVRRCLLFTATQSNCLMSNIDGDEGEGARIEFKELLARCAGREDAARKVLQLFQKSSQGTVSELSNAWTERDIDEVRRHAHGLKGMSANVAAKSVSALASDIELAARHEKFDEIGELVERLTVELDQCQDYIGQLLEQ